MPLTGNPFSTNMSEIADAGDQPPIHFLTVKAYGNMRNITQHFADQHRAIYFMQMRAGANAPPPPAREHYLIVGLHQPAATPRTAHLD